MDLLCLFAINVHAFNFELEAALEKSYFLWLEIKGMKIDSKKTQQIRIIMGQSLSISLQSLQTLLFHDVRI